MRLLPYGDRAVLVELGGTAEVVAWVDALRDADPAGLDDVVPAAQTVLVLAASPAALPGLRAALDAITPGTTGGAPGPDRRDATDVVEIAVRYDGPDLADVAAHTGLDESEVVATHTRTTWRVAFGGFAPGFGYLVAEGDGPAPLAVPRRESARTRVPAGAVGLAGDYTGVYPRESPGGWQLIGTTDAPMWDLDRDPPALLRPGARVRFTDAGAAS